jgi:hypothetical protein
MNPEKLENEAAAKIWILMHKPECERRRFEYATLYADEWLCYGRGWFRSWYICLHGCGFGRDGSTPAMNDECCGTLIPSKMWNLEIEGDPLAGSQRWHCWQHHRYNTSWGQVVEFMTVGGGLMYVRSSMPYGMIQNMRDIAIEEKVGHHVTIEEICNVLEVIPPQTSHGNIFVHKEAPRAMGEEQQRWFGIDMEFFNKLPGFDWHDMFNITEMEVSSRRSEETTSSDSRSTQVPSGVSTPPPVTQQSD